MGEGIVRSIRNYRTNALVFAVFDHDSLVSALQRVWDKVAPAAMFTAAGNHAVRGSENFTDALDMLKWNVKTSTAATSGFAQSSGIIGAVTGLYSNTSTNNSYGFSGTSAIHPNKSEGSNGGPASFDSDDNYFVESWNKGQDIYVPAGFEPMRGTNIMYVDSLPPFDVTMTFANEYGQSAFQKIYDLDILNESSGVSVDTVVMERHMTYIARRLSPLIRGVYNRESGGELKGLKPTSK